MQIAPELAAAPSPFVESAGKAPTSGMGTTATPSAPAMTTMQVDYGMGTEEDADDAAYILMRAFEETMGEIFPQGCTPDHQRFRHSQIVQSLGAAQAYNNGTYATPTRFAVARRRTAAASSHASPAHLANGSNGAAASSHAPERSVIGFVIWSLEGVATTEAQARATYVAPPFGTGPMGARMDLFRGFRDAMAECELSVMKGRPRASVKYLAIDPDVRRSGAGTGLMRLVRQDARAAGDLPIYLDAAETSSAPSFYKKLGFTNVGRAQAPGVQTGTQAMVLDAGDAAPLLDAQ